MAKISKASAVKKRPARAVAISCYGARSLLVLAQRGSKNDAFELHLRHEYRGFPFRPAVRSLITTCSLIEIRLASGCFQAASWFITQIPPLIGYRKLDAR